MMLSRFIAALLFAVFCTAGLAQEPPAPPAPPSPPAAPPAPPAAPAPPAPLAPPAPPIGQPPEPPPPGTKSLMESLGKGEPPAPPPPGEPPADSPEAKALAAAEKDTRRPKDVPAKYWDAQKGEVNYGAWATSTKELETKLRTTGLPPKEATDYKFEMPDALKAAGIDLDPAQNKAFREKAHGLALTQKQYEGMLGMYFDNLKFLADQAKHFSAASARTELLAHYKTEDAMKEAVVGAFKVFEAYADPKDFELINTIGNIPAVVRVLSKIWPEIREDPGINPDVILSTETLAELMRGGPGKPESPYWNNDDPRHAVTVAKVTRHHEARAAQERRKAA